MLTFSLIPPQTGYSLIAGTWVNSTISISKSLPWAGAWDPCSHTLDVCAAYNLLIPADPWLAAATRPGSEAGWSAVAQPCPGRGQLCQYDALSSMRLPPNEHHTHSISPHGASGPAGCATPHTRLQASSTAVVGIQKQERTKSSIYTPHCAPFQKPRRQTNEETTPGAGRQSAKCLPLMHKDLSSIPCPYVKVSHVATRSGTHLESQHSLGFAGQQALA